MSWEHELDHILSDLGVQQERAQSEQPSSEAEEEPFFITQVSRRYPGVSYRLDITDTAPELRVYVPTNEGAYKIRVYLVRLTPGSFLHHLIGLFMAFEGGSPAFQEVVGNITYHVLVMVLHAMKDLFWQGDLATLQFPAEIAVQCLL